MPDATHPGSGACRWALASFANCLLCELEPAAEPQVAMGSPTRIVLPPHACKSIGCRAACVLCQNNPNRQCQRNIKPKYIAEEYIRAACGTPLAAKLVDATGAGVSGGLPPGAKLEACLIQEGMYKAQEAIYKALEGPGSAPSHDALEACIITDKNNAVLKVGKNPIQPRCFLPLLSGQAALDQLKGTTSSKELPVCLLLRAVDANGNPLPDIGYVISESFVVVSKRAKGAMKIEFPSIDDPVDKITNIGDATAAKLKDLRAAAHAEHLSICLPDHLNVVTIVKQLQQLVAFGDADPDLQTQLRTLFKLTEPGWLEVRAHVNVAYDPNARPQFVWLRPGLQAGLLFETTTTGAVNLQLPKALIKIGGDGEHDTVIPITAQMDSALLTVCADLLKEAKESWFQPGHPGWNLHPTMPQVTSTMPPKDHAPSPGGMTPGPHMSEPSPRTPATAAVVVEDPLIASQMRQLLDFNNKHPQPSQDLSLTRLEEELLAYLNGLCGDTDALAAGIPCTSGTASEIHCSAQPTPAAPHYPMRPVAAQPRPAAPGDLVPPGSPVCLPHPIEGTGLVPTAPAAIDPSMFRTDSFPHLYINLSTICAPDLPTPSAPGSLPAALMQHMLGNARSGQPRAAQPPKQLQQLQAKTARPSLFADPAFIRRLQLKASPLKTATGLGRNKGQCQVLVAPGPERSLLFVPTLPSKRHSWMGYLWKSLPGTAPFALQGVLLDDTKEAGTVAGQPPLQCSLMRNMAMNGSLGRPSGSLMQSNIFSMMSGAQHETSLNACKNTSLLFRYGDLSQGPPHQGYTAAASGMNAWMAKRVRELSLEPRTSLEHPTKKLSPVHNWMWSDYTY